MEKRGGTELLSPVSKYNRQRAAELREQQRRISAISVNRLTANGSASDITATTSKRRLELDDDDVVPSSSSSKKLSNSASPSGKKRRRRSRRSSIGALNDRPEVSAEPVLTARHTGCVADHDARYLSYENTHAQSSAGKEKTPVTNAVENSREKSVRYREDTIVEKNALPLFSRFADPTIRKSNGEPFNSPVLHHSKQRLKHFDSLVVMKEQFARRAQRELDGDDALPRRDMRLHTSIIDEEVVDLEHVTNVTQLETVEGSEILQTLMGMSTPRAGRKFPIEESKTASEERERAFLRRRRLALRKKYSAQQDTEQWKTPKTVTDGPAVQIGGKLSYDDVEKDSEIASNATTADEESDASDDLETTESKIERLGMAKEMNWKYFLLWLVAGASMLCMGVMIAPFVPVLFQPTAPYCDNTSNDLALIKPFDQSQALQLYTERNNDGSCQPCPVYANCVNGGIDACIPPYELLNGMCVESSDVRLDLYHLSHSIEHYMRKKASDDLCSATFWSVVFGDGDLEQYTAPIKVLLSEIREFVLGGSPVIGKAVAELPREYVFGRALDMALRNLKDVFVTEDDAIYVEKSVVHWVCRSRFQLYSYTPMIFLATALASLLGLVYRKLTLHRTERQLIDRLVKEVRFTLLSRTGKLQRYYPADYLRDDLFDTLPIPPRHRKWLVQSVWPKVAALVEDDSRVLSRTAKIRGTDVTVWEWISSASPAKKEQSASSSNVMEKVRSSAKKRTGRKSFP